MPLSNLPLLGTDAPLALLGCGKMGIALLSGWLDGGLPGGQVAVIEPTPSDELRSLAVRASLTLVSDAGDLQTTPGAVLIAIKPQMMTDVVPGLGERFGSAPLYVSIAAGTGISFFEQVFGDQARVVRVMPNTPAAVGKGASALFANAACGAAERDLAAGLLGAVGLTVWLESESQMDAVTGVSGSGPAYVFHMIEALAQAGMAQGLDPDLAMKLARQTVIGAAALADHSGETAETLRVNVTSPGGTTAAALDVLMRSDSGLTALMTEAVCAATERSKALS